MDAKEYLVDTKFSFKMFPTWYMYNGDQYDTKKVFVELSIIYKNDFTIQRNKINSDYDDFTKQTYYFVKSYKNKDDCFFENISDFMISDNEAVYMTFDEYKNRLDELSLLASSFLAKFKRDFLDRAKFIEEINKLPTVSKN